MGSGSHGSKIYLDRALVGGVGGNGGGNSTTSDDELRSIKGCPAEGRESGGDSIVSKGHGSLGFGSSLTYGQDGENGWVKDFDLQ